MLRWLLQPSQGLGVALLQQPAQHVVHNIKQGLLSRLLESSSSIPSKSAQQQYHTQELQSAAVNDIEQLLPLGTLERNFKGCRAVFGFRVGNAGLYLPIEVKAGTVRDRSVQFTTAQPGRKGNLPLLLCRPYPMQGQTLVTTLAMAPQEKLTLTLGEGTKYYPFLVPDDKLGHTVTRVFEAVKDGKSHGMLPSGQVFDISTLQLVSSGVLSLPINQTGMRAREFYELRRQWLPSLNTQPPSQLHTPVDAIAAGAHLAEAVARCQVYGMGYRISLHKRCFRQKIDPLHEGDIDALWVYHPDKVHFWLIPAHVLVGKGVLATGQQQGKFSMCLYDQDYVKPQRRGEGANLWTQEYLLDSRDPGLMEKVMQVLEAAKPAS